MKPQLLKVSTGPAHSFSVRHDVRPVNNRWHFHPEVELIHIKNGSGLQFAGDNIRQFYAGDVVLLGPHLPHYWRFDDEYLDSNPGLEADITVAHFCEDFWGPAFLQLPENRTLRAVLEKSKRGVMVTGEARLLVARLLDLMVGAEGSDRIILLMRALDAMANSSSLSVLSSIGFQAGFHETDNRINNIYDYSLVNFKKKIELKEIAAVANISSNSFCRYFKSRTGKTYSQFLIEIKVGYACKMLIENKLNIKQLCYESGFNNFASFHKYFKLVTGKSPLVYQKEFVRPV